ncbi:MAG: TonB family protein [Deltaproteobacteria bacterium]|nr:TonB family protein [Deltaproteobacteria bacterium]
MAATEIFKRRRFEGVGVYTLAALVALGAHGAISAGASQLKEPKKATRVEMAMVKQPPKPEPPKPEPPKPEPAKPKPKPKPEVVQPVVKPETPPPNQPPPSEKPSKPIPIVTGISLNSTVSGSGGVAVRVGNTLYGDVNKEKFVPSSDVKPYVPAPAFAPVKTHEITEEPEILKEIKAPMPEAAKRAGVQGTVVLKVEVKKDGTVRNVTVVKGIGYGLDEAAVEAMKKFLFKPAKVNGKPVDYTISRFNYVFELVD